MNKKKLKILSNTISFILAEVPESLPRSVPPPSAARGSEEAKHLGHDH